MEEVSSALKGQDPLAAGTSNAEVPLKKVWSAATDHAAPTPNLFTHPFHQETKPPVHKSLGSSYDTRGVIYTTDPMPRSLSAEKAQSQHEEKEQDVSQKSLSPTSRPEE
jgi:hypothetical protein